MEVDPTRMCELLVGRPAVIVLGVIDAGGKAPLRVHVEMRDGRRSCGGCGAMARVKERPDQNARRKPIFLVSHWCR